MWTHLAGLIGGVAAALSVGLSLPIALLAVLILWLLKREQSPFVDDHGREALNFQISILIYALLVVPLAALLTCGLGLVLIIPVAVLDVVGCVRGAQAAHAGHYYRYPACIRFVSPAL